MTARLASALPKDANSNGLTSIETELIERPHDTHVVIGIIDTRKTIIDAEKDETIPYARFRHIEVMTDDADEADARSMMIKALTLRTGAQTLPFEADGADDDDF
jgi:hypothetical protein